ncbi:putative adipose-regulatory protein-domain-containing protein [Xylariaceae sp. FL1651]|nr:putative adipose-regulatory protein-domain-containing protein [Xylariaceae sp. FL1651]
MDVGSVSSVDSLSHQGSPARSEEASWKAWRGSSSSSSSSDSGAKTAYYMPNYVNNFASATTGHFNFPPTVTTACFRPVTTVISGDAAAPDGAFALSQPGNMEYVKTPYRVATSPGAKRTYLGAFLFVAASLALLCVAALAYPVFYYNYVPKKLISIPIYLQYNAGLNPYGVTSLSSNLMLEQAYDVSVELTLPRSPANLERGNFMVALYAMKSKPDNPAFAFSVPSDPYEHVTNNNVVFSSRRPALIPYQDSLVSTASRILFLLYHIIFSHVSQTTTLVIPMGELVEFRDVLPLSILLDVQAGQTLQVYSCTITLVARLTGIRWFMYNHRILSFVACTTIFWFAEMLSMGIAWITLEYFRSRRKSKDFIKSGAGQEPWTPIKYGEMMDPDYEQSPMTKTGDEARIKEESTEQDTLVEFPRHTGDADDEDDSEDVWKESGAGMSFNEGQGGGLRRRSSWGGRA